MDIRLENVSKFYYSSTNVCAGLQKINLELPDRGFVAITGESGSGKSTFISVISGLLSFEEGEIYINGEPMSEYDDSDLESYRKNRIGFVFQEYNLIDEYTVYENVESAIIIRGMRTENIREHAEKIIQKVGLWEFVNQKAIRLSSGQKQRLAIARALAKDADVIFADEPTGNLDSENATRIMELFADIAKEKLVVMVTHNYDIAQPYINRLIRMFDGKIVSDTDVKQINNLREKSADKKEIEATDKRQNRNKIAWKYTLKNIIRQPVKTLFIALFVLLTAVLSYIFVGQIAANYDDTHTRIYDDNVFAYESDKRIIVKKPDGSSLTNADYELFSSMKYVVAVEEYDLCNDIRYANIPGEDYYETKPGSNLNIIIGGMSSYANNGQYISFNEKAEPKYMKSASCITADDLAEGRLPQKRNEIVMYANDKLDEVHMQKIYLRNKNLWGDTYYEQDFVVVGVLKEETTQIYFSAKFCDMLTASQKQERIRLEGAWCAVFKQYRYRDMFIPVIDDGLAGKALSLSEYYFMPYERCNGVAHMNCTLVSKSDGEVNVYADKLLNTGKTDGLVYEKLKLCETSEEILAPFICLSEEFFYELYEKGSHQASLYIDHYAHTDKILKRLEKEGYDAISSYRVSTLEQDADKADNRVRLLIISFSILIVMAVLEVFIVFLFMGLRKKFYAVFKFMGMERNVIKRINYLEVNLYTVVSVTFTMIAMWVADICNAMPWIGEFRVYLDFIHYVIYILYNLLLAQLVALLFNRKYN